MYELHICDPNNVQAPQYDFYQQIIPNMEVYFLKKRYKEKRAYWAQYAYCEKQL